MGKVIHASYSGYFPTCIISGTPTPSQEYLSLTLEQAMALFWRVRTWEAKASGSFRDNVLEANIEYTSGSFADMIPSIEIEEEKNLVYENYIKRANDIWDEFTTGKGKKK
jgi:hypothetical protein